MVRSGSYYSGCGGCSALSCDSRWGDTIRLDVKERDARGNESGYVSQSHTCPTATPTPTSVTVAQSVATSRKTPRKKHFLGAQYIVAQSQITTTCRHLDQTGGQFFGHGSQCKVQDTLSKRCWTWKMADIAFHKCQNKGIFRASPSDCAKLTLVLPAATGAQLLPPSSTLPV